TLRRPRRRRGRSNKPSFYLPRHGLRRPYAWPAAEASIRSSAESAPLERGLALLSKGRRSFGEVRRLGEVAEGPGFQLQGVLQAPAIGRQHDLLGELLGERRARGQAFGVSQRMVEQRVLRNDPVDQADAEGVLGIYAVARQD